MPSGGVEFVGIPVGPNVADSNSELPDTYEALQVDSAQRPSAQETGVTITRFESTAGGAGRDVGAEQEGRQRRGVQRRGVDETLGLLERASEGERASERERASAPALHMLRS